MVIKPKGLKALKSPNKTPKLKRSVRFIESILPTDTGQEVNILPELIKMVGYPVNVITINGKISKKIFIQKLLDGLERYVHISAHGDQQGFYIHGDRGTHIGVEHISQHCVIEKYKEYLPLKNRFLTVSACGDPSLSFWEKFNKLTGVCAVIAPMGEVCFEESAMFYASFYFALLRHPRSSKGAVTSERLIDFVDTFQRTKGAYLALGGNGAYRLCFWYEDNFKEII